MERLLDLVCIADAAEDPQNKMLLEPGLVWYCNHSPTMPKYTVMILSFRTDMPGQTVQTQIRLLLEEQSDQGLHVWPFRLHCLDSLLYGRAT